VFNFSLAYHGLVRVRAGEPWVAKELLCRILESPVRAGVGGRVVSANERASLLDLGLASFLGLLVYLL